MLCLFCITEREDKQNKRPMLHLRLVSAAFRLMPRSSPSPSPPTAVARPSKRARLTTTTTPADDGTLNYRNGIFLAPMVRIGTLTTRLLALDYGAHLVWGPEIVDRAIIGSQRIVNEDTGVVSFVKTGPKAIWETHPIEKSRLIYQIGSADRDLALQAANTVAGDVSGIDLNCGCPKPFSVKGGMGAALLKEPDRLCGILAHLVDHLPGMPISAKIRLLPTSEATLSLVRRICATGISCLTVHCRTQDMRSTEPALHDRLREIADCVDDETKGRVAVVANGDCWNVDSVESIKLKTGVSSVMIARGAEANPSCFRQQSGYLDPEEVVIPKYIRIGIATGQNYGNAKYCISAMDLKKSSRVDNNDSGRSVSGNKAHRSDLKSRITQCKTWQDMADLFNVDVEASQCIKIEDEFKNLSVKQA